MRRVAPQSTRTVWISSRGYSRIRHPPAPSDARRAAEDSPPVLRVPLVDLFAGGQPHAFLLLDVVVDRLEILDAVRDAGDVRMDGHGHDARILRAFRV